MKKYILLLICLFLAALNFNLILSTLKLVTGGTQGLAILLSQITSLKSSIIIFIINITTLTISYFFLTKKSTNSALIATFAYPLFVRLTNNFNSFNFIEKNIYLSVIMAGIICGITNALIYKIGFSSGGITILNLLINKYLKIKIAISNFLVNSLIIILGFFLFGFKKTILALIVISISSLIIYLILRKKASKTN